MAQAPPHIVPVKPGDVLAGKYRVERVLGSGGMGVVVAARHIQLDELVALKFLLPSAIEKEVNVARFLREAQAAVRIKSDHVARVSDVGKLDNGAPYLVMEYLDGDDLGHVLQKNGPMPVELVVTYVLQCCEAIAEAHALGIVHRDLKPSNLFLARRLDGVPVIKVLDFGIAKAMSTPEDDALTATNATMGSPRYMSPEQVRSARRVDARSDIWSLGIVLHELVAGTAPFSAESTAGLLAAMMMDEPRRLRECRFDAPEELERIVLRCLKKDPNERYADLGELALALAPLAPEARASVDLVTRIMAAIPEDVARAPLVSSPELSRSNAAPTQKVEPHLLPPQGPTVPDTKVTLEDVSITHHGDAPAEKSRLVPIVASLAAAGVLITFFVFRGAGSDPGSGATAAPARVEPSPTSPPSASASPPASTSAAPATPTAVVSAAPPASSAPPKVQRPTVIRPPPAGDRKGEDRH